MMYHIILSTYEWWNWLKLRWGIRQQWQYCHHLKTLTHTSHYTYTLPPAEEEGEEEDNDEYDETDDEDDNLVDITGEED